MSWPSRRIGNAIQKLPSVPENIITQQGHRIYYNDKKHELARECMRRYRYAKKIGFKLKHKIKNFSSITNEELDRKALKWLDKIK